jgi:hypothetical protein
MVSKGMVLYVERDSSRHTSSTTSGFRQFKFPRGLVADIAGALLEPYIGQVGLDM